MLRLLRKGKIPENKHVGRIVYFYGYFCTICFGGFAVVTIIRYFVKAMKYVIGLKLPGFVYRSKTTERERKLFNIEGPEISNLYADLERMFNVNSGSGGNNVTMSENL